MTFAPSIAQGKLLSSLMIATVNVPSVPSVQSLHQRRTFDDGGTIPREDPKALTDLDDTAAYSACGTQSSTLLPEHIGYGEAKRCGIVARRGLQCI